MALGQWGNARLFPIHDYTLRCLVAVRLAISGDGWNLSKTLAHTNQPGVSQTGKRGQQLAIINHQG